MVLLACSLSQCEPRRSRARLPDACETQYRAVSRVWMPRTCNALRQPHERVCVKHTPLRTFGEVDSRQAIRTKCCLFSTHVLEMVGLEWHPLSAKALLSESPGSTRGPDRRRICDSSSCWRRVRVSNSCHLDIFSFRLPSCSKARVPPTFPIDFIQSGRGS